MNRNPIRTAIEGTIIGVILTAASYWTAIFAGWIVAGELPALEVSAVFTSYVCTWMCVQESRWNYPVGMVTTVLYAVLFWRQELFASALLNSYLPFALAYGWWRWGPDKKTRPVRSLLADKRYGLVVGYLAITGGVYGALVLLLLWFNATLPATDTAILVGSILAQLLLDNKRIETWGIWAVVNCFAIWTYAEAGLPLAALQFVFFLGNTVVGYLKWRRSMILADDDRLSMAVYERAVADGRISYDDADFDDFDDDDDRVVPRRGF